MINRLSKYSPWWPCTPGTPTFIREASYCGATGQSPEDKWQASTQAWGGPLDHLFRSSDNITGEGWKEPKSQRIGRQATKRHLLVVLYLLHAWTHGGSGYLHKSEPITVAIMHGEGNHEPPSPSEVQAWTINGCWGEEYHFVPWYSHWQVALAQANNLLPTLNKKLEFNSVGSHTKRRPEIRSKAIGWLHSSDQRGREIREGNRG